MINKTPCNYCKKENNHMDVNFLQYAFYLQGFFSSSSLMTCVPHRKVQQCILIYKAASLSQVESQTTSSCSSSSSFRKKRIFTSKDLETCKDPNMSCSWQSCK